MWIIKFKGKELLSHRSDFPASCWITWDLRWAPARKEGFRRDRCVALPKSQLTDLARECTALWEVTHKTVIHARYLAWGVGSVGDSMLVRRKDNLTKLEEERDHLWCTYWNDQIRNLSTYEYGPGTGKKGRTGTISQKISLRKSQVETLELENTMIEIKQLTDGFHSLWLSRRKAVSWNQDVKDAGKSVRKPWGMGKGLPTPVICKGRSRCEE